ARRRHRRRPHRNPRLPLQSRLRLRRRLRRPTPRLVLRLRRLHRLLPHHRRPLPLHLEPLSPPFRDPPRMSNPELPDLLSLAVDAAYLGGRRTLAYFNTPLTIDTKSDATPVTIADR